MHFPHIYLHNPNNRATITGEIMHPGDHISGIKESDGMGGQNHIHAHHGRRRPRQRPSNRQPHQEVTGEGLKGPREEHDPGPTAAGVGGGGIEEAGEDPDIGSEVFEDGDGVEGGLVVGLGGFQDRGVDAEGVEGAAGALDPYARGRGHPLVLDQGFSARVVIQLHLVRIIIIIGLVKRA